MVPSLIGIFRFVVVGFFFNILSYAIGYWKPRISRKLSLFCLGIGWNFLFVGGTYLLTKTYQSEERFKVQAFNDFCVLAFKHNLYCLVYCYTILLGSFNQMAFFILIAIASIFLFYQKSIRTV